MTPRRFLVLTLVVSLLATPGFWPVAPPSPARARGVDVFMNITGGQKQKLNIAIPEFAVTTGADAAGAGKLLASVTGADLTFTGLFSVVAATGSIPPNNPAALKQSWSEFAAAGAHAGVHGLLALRGDRAEVEYRLYDLTSPEQRMIASKKFELPVGAVRRLAHKVADEIVLQFTGEAGVADTKIAYVSGPVGAKEIVMADYDGVGIAPVTKNGSINLSPVWSPDARSLAFTSFKQGYPDLYRTFPFERRPEQTLAAFVGINSSPAFSPDGREIAMTLSVTGNPEIHVLSLATGTMRRLTRHAGIDTEPTWSPTGRQIAFISDRGGVPHVFVMDDQGLNVRQVTASGFHTQPRWSPRGDLIAYTQRAGAHDIWVVDADGANPRRLTSGGDNQGAAWSPNGRHLAFQSNRLGRWQLFAVLADGSASTPLTRGQSESTSPSWSPRLP
ncbi:MAG TPA: Tol-Pal system beta propeller repeat protein TolB [Methylomirabilota bacterium]|nr:Tol-Pal system beta propeller repeat protein TolB [Methylomirabilota bacterium]